MPPSSENLAERHVRLRADLYSLQRERLKALSFASDVEREIALKEGELRVIEGMLAEHAQADQQ